MSAQLPSGKQVALTKRDFEAGYLATSPFLRWAGGKKWLVKEVNQIIGRTDFNRYHEPFLGGGAMYFAVGSKRPSYLSDINLDLINTYIAVRDDPLRVISEMRNFENNSVFYYRVRDQEPRCMFQKAAQFIYLNQTSFNGLYRVNLKGRYNVPYGSRSKPFLDENAILACSRQLEHATIRVQDFEQAIESVLEDDLVFLDPPYTVAHNKNGFIKYNEALFRFEDQKRLATAIKEISKRGARFIMTNANHVSIDAVFEGCGRRMELTRASLIGGRSAVRGHTTELLFTNL
jgi:DNA adenine methylase